MNTFFADFHVHIGRSAGRPVKMAAASSLTLEAILTEARERKGLDIVTVIDAVCTPVLQELQKMKSEDRIRPIKDGGYQFENGLMLLLGAEVEVAGPSGGAAHFGSWFGDLDAAADFHDWLSTVQTNTSLSSQRARTNAVVLQEQTRERGGLFIVHHAFTPHKGLYGNCVRQMSDMVNPRQIDALELGLSADSNMGDTLDELQDVTFLSNSDAHSLPKIAREYNALALCELSFLDVSKALHRVDGRRVSENFGLHPELGKYHRSRCAKCGQPWPSETNRCSCGSRRLVRGVYDRLVDIRDRSVPNRPSHRPPYRYQVPLQFIPGVGPKTLERLLDAFGSEMAVLNQIDTQSLESVVGHTLAAIIDKSRRGEVEF
ncbi:MAG: endonuclease Q family protein, partial [Coriobacteriia bacterium]